MKAIGPITLKKNRMLEERSVNKWLCSYLFKGEFGFNFR